MILCVDDHEFSLAVRKLLLERQGHRVITAITGEEGVAKFRRHPIALAIIDYYLPDGTGEELAHKLKDLKPEVPVLMLSGAVNLPEDMSAVDVLLSKVESPQVFLETVENLLGRTEPVRATG